MKRDHLIKYLIPLTCLKIKGNCKAKPIRPESDNRSWMIGNVNEKMDADTTYKGIFMPHDQQQKAVAHRPHENGKSPEVNASNRK